METEKYGKNTKHSSSDECFVVVVGVIDAIGTADQTVTSIRRGYCFYD